MSTRIKVLVGTAGWVIPKPEQGYYLGEGSHLARYAAFFPVVEINSTFHRPHRPATYERWRDSVPEAFRFSVKVPKTITHEQRLEGTENLLADFLREVGILGSKLGCLLVQLPPSLACDPVTAGAFFSSLRAATRLPIALEPRHASWFEPEGAELLAEYDLSRVATDPTKIEAARRPAGSRGVAYYRLHGSPRTYYSAYTSEYLTNLAAQLQSSGHRELWCIFDNTTLGAAAANARELIHALEHPAISCDQKPDRLRN